jgi:hypothetical protein
MHRSKQWLIDGTEPYGGADSRSAGKEFPFMEREVSLPRSQQPITGTYPELDESSSHHNTLFP